MKRVVSHFIRAAGAVGLVGALLLGPLGVQGAGAELQSYSADADGFALRVVVDLRVLPAPVKAQIQTAYSALRASLPADGQALLAEEFSFLIDQRLIETITAAKAGVTQADAYLARGLANFPTSSSSSMDKSQSITTATRQLPSADLPVLDVAAGLLNTSVVVGPKVNANATLAEVGVALESLGDLLPVDLQSAFGDLVTAANTAIASANAALDGALAGVGDSVSKSTDNPAFAPVIALLPAGQAPTAENITTQLQTVISVPNLANALDTKLAALTALTDTSTAQQMPDKAVADAAATIASVDVLNGLFSAGLVDVSSHSEAAGTPGTARNASTCSIADARLGGNNGVSLDGKNIYVSGARVPIDEAAVAGVKSAIDTVLSKVGLSVALCETVDSEAAGDGTHASQTMSALRVEFSPPAPVDIAALGIAAGDPLIRVIIDPTVHSAVTAQPTVVAPGGLQLPRTGAAIIPTLLIGLALFGGSFAWWRRSRSSS